MSHGGHIPIKFDGIEGPASTAKGAVCRGPRQRSSHQIWWDWGSPRRCYGRHVTLEAEFLSRWRSLYDKAWKRHPKGPPNWRFWKPLGPLWDPIWGPLFDKTWHFFQCKITLIFWLIFQWIWGGFWEAFGVQKWRKKRHRSENCVFSKMSVSFTRELNFGGSRDPKSIQKAPINGLKNRCIFWMKKSSKIESKRVPKGIPKSFQHALKQHLKKH